MVAAGLSKMPSLPSDMLGAVGGKMEVRRREEGSPLPGGEAEVFEGGSRLRPGSKPSSQISTGLRVVLKDPRNCHADSIPWVRPSTATRWQCCHSVPP